MTMKERAAFILKTDTPEETFCEVSRMFTDEGDEIFLNPRKIGGSTKWYTNKRGYKDSYFSDDERYIMAEDFSNISLTSCRKCKKEKGAYYPTNYLMQERGYLILYCFENGYCEECAKAKAAQVLPKLPKEEKPIKVKESYTTGELIYWAYWANGEVTYYKPNALQKKVLSDAKNAMGKAIAKKLKA